MPKGNKLHCKKKVDEGRRFWAWGEGRAQRRPCWTDVNWAKIWKRWELTMHADIWRKGYASRENPQCKGSQAGAWQGVLGTARSAWEVKGRERTKGSEVREVQGPKDGRPFRGLWLQINREPLKASDLNYALKVFSSCCVEAHQECARAEERRPASRQQSQWEMMLAHTRVVGTEVVGRVGLLEIVWKQRLEDCCDSRIICGVTEIKRIQELLQHAGPKKLEELGLPLPKMERAVGFVGEYPKCNLGWLSLRYLWTC